MTDAYTGPSDDDVADLRAENARLRAENAQLRPTPPTPEDAARIEAAISRADSPEAVKAILAENDMLPIQ